MATNAYLQNNLASRTEIPYRLPFKRRKLMYCRRKSAPSIHSSCVCATVVSLLDAKLEKQNLNAVKWGRNVTVAVKFALAALSMTKTNEEELSIQKSVNQETLLQKSAFKNLFPSINSEDIYQVKCSSRHGRFKSTFGTVFKWLQSARISSKLNLNDREIDNKL